MGKTTRLAVCLGLGVLGASALAQPVTANPAPVAPSMTLPQDTEVDLRFSQTITSANARVGDRIVFTVEKPVKLGDRIIIPEGASARGTVTVAKPKKWAGRAGQLGWSVDSVTLPSGQVILLTGGSQWSAEGHGSAVTAGVIGSAVVLPIAAPFVLMVHGHNYDVPEGTEYRAFVDHDTPIIGK